MTESYYKTLLDDRNKKIEDLEEKNSSTSTEVTALKEKLIALNSENRALRNTLIYSIFRNGGKYD